MIVVMADSVPPPLSVDPPTSASDEFRALRRSATDRVVAGVLGGLGKRLGIDPLVLRITTVVLAIFGGVGVLLYAVAWLLVPAEGEDGSILDHAIGRGEDRDSSTVGLAIGLGAVTVIGAAGIVAGSWEGGVLLVLAAAGVFVAMRRHGDIEREHPHRDTSGPEHAPFYAPDSGPGESGPGESGRGESDGSSGAAEPPAGWSAEPASTADDTSAEPISGVTSVGWPEGPDWGPTRSNDIPPPPEQAPPQARRATSALGPLTVCTALVSVGVMAIVHGSGSAMPIAMFVAVPLAIVAAGLIVGTWFGRSRGLIALGIVLSLALIPTTFLSHWEVAELDASGSYRYTSVADVPAGTRSHSAGDVHYNLSDLNLSDLAPGDTVALSVTQGVGKLTIIVPGNADVTVNASTMAGETSIFGRSVGGLGQNIDVTDYGPDGPGGGRIDLDLDLGLGELEVTR